MPTTHSPMIQDANGNWVPNPKYVNDPNNEFIPSATQQGRWIPNPNYNPNKYVPPLFDKVSARLLRDIHDHTKGEECQVMRTPAHYVLLDSSGSSFCSPSEEDVDFEFI